ncbi:unnamed protein product [Protopolystoma xenopodis]|uniref:Uncharacterized protein n=1 Tax=Protopolystoma xenopodis TaxID=117903 RepID=A0A3S5CSF3_9PLAT|nr:unnamed protein product [Protopolystoma xenopodis]
MAPYPKYDYSYRPCEEAAAPWAAAAHSLGITGLSDNFAYCLSKLEENKNRARPANGIRLRPCEEAAAPWGAAAHSLGITGLSDNFVNCLSRLEENKNRVRPANGIRLVLGSTANRRKRDHDEEYGGEGFSSIKRRLCQ